MKHSHATHIGTAGWTIPSAHRQALAEEGSHLARYAQVMNCVEINSTFYRTHREGTFRRWAETTPDAFRFAVKAPKTVTHGKKLDRCGGELAAFFASVQPLGTKLGPVLVQLPPRLAFDEGTAHDFFSTLRELHPGAAVVEPRHASWFTSAANQLLRSFEVARAMADPPAGSTEASSPGGWAGLRYFRLHGSPRKYWSAYPDEALDTIAATVTAQAAETWVIFDNTAQGHALGDALKLRDRLEDLV